MKVSVVLWARLVVTPGWRTLGFRNVMCCFAPSPPICDCICVGSCFVPLCSFQRTSCCVNLHRALMSGCRYFLAFFAVFVCCLLFFCLAVWFVEVSFSSGLGHISAQFAYWKDEPVLRPDESQEGDWRKKGCKADLNGLKPTEIETKTMTEKPSKCKPVRKMDLQHATCIRLHCFSCAGCLFALGHLHSTLFFFWSAFFAFRRVTTLRLTRGPAGNRTTTGSLSATQECRDTNWATRTPHWHSTLWMCYMQAYSLIWQSQEAIIHWSGKAKRQWKKKISDALSNSFISTYIVWRPGESHRGVGRKKKMEKKLLALVLCLSFGCFYFCRANVSKDLDLLRGRVAQCWICLPQQTGREQTKMQESLKRGRDVTSEFRKKIDHLISKKPTPNWPTSRYKGGPHRVSKKSADFRCRKQTLWIYEMSQKPRETFGKPVGNPSETLIFL